MQSEKFRMLAMIIVTQLKNLKKLRQQLDRQKRTLDRLSRQQMNRGLQIRLRQGQELGLIIVQIPLQILSYLM
jgi:hypothetical protein